MATLETQEAIMQYYSDSNKDSYLHGILGGTCHFGYTPEGKEFRLHDALHHMEMQLGSNLDLPDGAHVVDAGCGYGRVATTLAREFGFRIPAFDLNPSRLHEAQRYAESARLPEQGVFTPQFTVADYTKLPIEDAQVDGLYTMETLCHAPDLYRALAEFYRVLKPGGKMVIHDYTINPLEEMGMIARPIADAMINLTGMPSTRYFHHGAFTDILTKGGFVNITETDITEQVIPHWRMFFYKAIAELGDLLPGVEYPGVRNWTNWMASVGIYPYRNNLRYITVSAEKPR